MTAERRRQLEARMALLIRLHSVYLVEEQLAGRLSLEQVNAAIYEAAEIGACIGTAHIGMNLGGRAHG